MSFVSGDLSWWYINFILYKLHNKYEILCWLKKIAEMITYSVHRNSNIMEDELKWLRW